jgi:hypothetical protein
MHPLWLVTALLAASPSTAPAPEAAAPAPAAEATPPTTPPARLSELETFAGRWACEGKPPAAGAKHALTPRSTLTVERDLGGFWFAGRQVYEKTAADKAPTTRLFYWSFDPVIDAYVGGWLDSKGGWLTYTSPRWEKDVLLFNGHAGGTPRRAAKETFSRPAAEAFTHTVEIAHGSPIPEWRVVADETCRRAAKPPKP